MNSIILGFGDAYLKYAHLESVKKEEASDEKSVDSNSDIPLGEDVKKADSGGYKRSRFFSLAGQSLIEKFASMNNIPLENIQQNVRFAKYLDSSDPIMEYRAVFDGYLKRPIDEVFFECTHSLIGPYVYYKFYYMISLVIHYARINKKSAKLVLLTPKYPPAFLLELYGDSPARNIDKELERLRNNFNPAIQNGFLEIVPIEYTLDECIKMLASINPPEK